MIKCNFIKAASCKPKIRCFAIIEVFAVVTLSVLSDNATLFTFLNKWIMRKS